MLVLGNIIALVASILMVYTGYLKKKKKLLYVQNIQIALLVVSDIILGGITGAIINFIGLIRNILCYKNKLTKKAKIIIIIISTILSFMFNNLKFIGLFPLISGIVYVWYIDIKDIVKFKYVIIFTMIMWGIYDLTIKSYTSALFDFLNIVASLIAISKIKKQRRKNKRGRTCKN